jgi:thymidylate synthase (FAD)
MWAVAVVDVIAMSEVKLVAKTIPCGIEGVTTGEEFIAYAARVSNPGNQINNETAPKLLRYLAKHKHWSPFEQVSLTFEIKTTRDIGRQILRHRSFTFQEFSQRYAAVTDQFEFREARLQDNKNRQNSISTDDKKLATTWKAMQAMVQNVCRSHYEAALEMGIAKEQARALLPEGMTKSTMYMTGTLRSFIHYCELRGANGTQKEHMEIANRIWMIIVKEFPSLSSVLATDEPKVEVKKQMPALEAVELPPLTKDQVEKVFNDFIRENRYIPQKESYTFTAPQPTWLDPYPKQHQVVICGDKDSY